MPDDDRGDGGLEAFSLDGCAYQCYAPENEPLSAKIRYEKQRNKMTADVGKFINNSAKIAALIPDGVKIRRWILLVPYISSRLLYEHAKTQTDRVRSAALDYADAQVIVGAQTLRAYEKAKVAVVSRQLSRLSLPAPPSTDLGAIDDDHIDTMNSKLAKTAFFQDTGRRRQMSDRLLGNYVAGDAQRRWLRDQYSELGDELEDQLADLEQRLAMQYPLDEPNPDRLLRAVLEDTEQAVLRVLKVKTSDGRVIAEGQVADWLMRCPLDFQ